MRRVLGVSDADEEHKLQFVRVGVHAQAMVVALGVAYELLGGQVTSQDLFWAAVAAAVLGLPVVAALPWRRLVERGLDGYALFTWSVLDIVLIAVVLAATGGTRSALVGLFGLTTVFYAMIYPLPAQWALLALTVASHFVVGAATATAAAPPEMLVKTGIIIILQYMTNVLVRAVRSERQAIRELEELTRLKDAFIETASHELRTPLAVIVGVAQTLDAHWADLPDPTRRRLVSRLNANGTALTEVVGTFLDFSRLQQGRLPIRRERIRLDELVASVVKRVRPLFGGHLLRMHLSAEVTVDADAALLERVVENLLANAVRHTPPGTNVDVSLEEAGGRVVFRISDDGPGIPADELPHVGTRFFRAGRVNTSDSRGLGLGLALCKEILHAHDTSLEITSATGVGTTARFTLPPARPLGPAPSVGPATAATAPVVSLGRQRP